MSEILQDDIREERIAMEIVVDAYNEEEVAMGWYYYLQDKINFPFKARWINRHEPEGRNVIAIEMSSEDYCLDDMFIEVVYREGDFEDIFSARLSEIKPLKTDAATTEAIDDWHYWVKRGYQF